MANVFCKSLKNIRSTWIAVASGIVIIGIGVAKIFGRTINIDMPSPRGLLYTTNSDNESNKKPSFVNFFLFGIGYSITSLSCTLPLFLLIIISNISAPVTIIEYGDFHCPFCDRFAKDTEPQINQTYIQTGRVNMAFKHFTIYGPDSITAAIASQCANDQARFWNFYEMLYKNQGAVNLGWASKDNLKKFASQISGYQELSTVWSLTGKGFSMTQ